MNSFQARCAKSECLVLAEPSNSEGSPWLFRMDAFDNLPYQIPGPAGGVSFPTLSQAARGELNGTDAFRIFRQPSWNALLCHLRAPPFGDSQLHSSVAMLRSHGLSDRFQRVPHLAVLLDAMTWVGHDASVKLRDPTGVIRATIHAEVFHKWKTGIEHGASLLLKGVAAVAYVEKRPKGFRTDAGEALHVSIQLCHVSQVFPVGKKLPGAKVERVVQDPKKSYTMQALSPPVVRRPPSRRTQNPQQHRIPLQLRQEHHANNRIVRRPNSARGHAPYQSQMSAGNFQSPQQMHGTNFRPDNSAQSNKRSFTPHHIPLHAGVRRPGMQPPFKRPVPNRSTAPSRINPLIVPPAIAVESITDDQLDDLLGDFDVDAVIAASGRSPSQRQSQTKTAQPSQGNPETKLRPKHVERVVSGNAVNPPVLSPQVPNIASETARNVAQSNSTCARERKNSATSTQQPGADTTEKEATAPMETRAGKHAPSAVDEAMIDNLLEGLDSSDFG